MIMCPSAPRTGAPIVFRMPYLKPRFYNKAVAPQRTNGWAVFPAMHPCSACQTRTMVRSVDKGDVIFRCACGYEEKGKGKDRLLRSTVAQSDQAQKYETLFRAAPFSRTEYQDKRECKKCLRGYMTMVVVGDERAVVWSCTCGNVETLK